MTRDVGSLEPLELLYESSAPAASALTPPLARLYGGGLGFEGPTAYANFVTSVDGTVETARMLEVDVLDARGAIAESSELEAARETASFALRPFAVDEESDPLLDAEIGVVVGSVELLLQRTGEAVHAQLGELLEGLLDGHASPFS